MAIKNSDRYERELKSLESELTQRLTRELPNVVAGRNTLLFFTDEHNPHELPHLVSEQSNDLLNLARQTIELRKRLVLPTHFCIGSLFVAACDESADLNNPHRLGPKRLAERLLSQIRDLSSEMK